MEVGIRKGVCNNSPAEATSPENGWRSSVEPNPGCRGKDGVRALRGRDARQKSMPRQVGRSQRCALKVSDASPPGAAVGADLGGSSKYSSENLED